MRVQGEEEKELKVMVAEEGTYARSVLEDIIRDAPGLLVAGKAATSDDLLLQLQRERADVVLLDHDLPGNAQLLTLKRIFSEQPAFVLLLVLQEQLTLELMQQAIELGVYGVVIKPGKGHYINYRGMAAEIVEKILAVRAYDPAEGEHRQRLWQQVIHELPLKSRQGKRQNTTDTIVVIGASTGGTQAIEKVIAQLATDLEATVLVALHLPQSFTNTYAQRLQDHTGLEVQEGYEGLMLKKRQVIVAPGGRNMVVRSTMGNKSMLSIAFSSEETATYDLPSVDLLMKSVSESAVPHQIGVILTGMGKDGTEGAAHIQGKGGLTLAQDEESSTIYGMAKSAIESGHIDKVLPLADIAHFLNRYVAGKQQISATDSVA
ncbi:response regulator [Pontibacter sp. E15-1]|uniref:chemotaxis protein CheB n=1 Tax=Pontibacter sp. E15-1 TaxID=2919918 RepID=UPI001F4FAD50|nr:chemotaxis protein CheB [Pontibacter sp. E15-1]MCJ8166654.1 response regulator [Pontibacter sp. E15-1]